MCRSFYAATFFANGREVVEIRARIQATVATEVSAWIKRRCFEHERSERLTLRLTESFTTHPRMAYNTNIIRIEAQNPTQLRVLTCVMCGVRKSHGPTGFCDKQFDQTLKSRFCIDCRMPVHWDTPHMRIHGISVKRCVACRNVCPRPRRLTRIGPAIPEHQCREHMRFFEEVAAWRSKGNISQSGKRVEGADL